MYGLNSSNFLKHIQSIFTVFILMSPALAHAIVSMESVHLQEPPQGFVGNFDLNVDAEYGNTEKSSVSTGAKLQWTRDNTTNFVLGNYAYGKSFGVKDKNKSFVHLRHIHQLNDTLAWEAFTQFSHNEFTRLKLRALFGGGGRLAIGRPSDKRAAYLGLGAFFEREKLDIDPASNENDTENTVRANTYLVLKYQFNPYVSVVSSTYYQPALDQFSDFRAIEIGSLVSKLTNDLALHLAVDIEHDSKPPAGIKQTDSSLTIGFSLTF